MHFRREHVANPDSHYRLPAQLCLREISETACIDFFDDFTVQCIDAITGAGAPSRRCAQARRGRRVSNESKTNNAQAYGRHELEAIILFQPTSEQFREADVFTKTRGDSFAAEAAEYEPRL